MVLVRVTWGGQLIDIDADPEQPGAVLKAQLWTQTNVPPERQKILGFKGGVLTDDIILGAAGLKEGMRLMLVGTAQGGELQCCKEKTVFVEDLTPEERIVVLKEKKIEVPPKGIVNCGMTCYLSSMIQFLRPVKEFTDLVKELPGNVNSPDVDLQLCAAFRGFYRTQEMSVTANAPFLILQFLRAKFPQFAQKATGPMGGYMQQDAEECLSLVLDLINRRSPNNAIDALFGFDMEKKITCKEDPENALPAEPLRETSRVLSCHLGSQMSAVDHLHQGLERSLSGKMFKISTHLGREAEHHTTSRLASLPPYLIVHFVRFEWKGRNELARTEAGRAKICRKVTFPTTLDVYNIATASLQQKLQAGRRIKGDRLESDKAENAPKKQKSDTETAPSSANSADSGTEADTVVNTEDATRNVPAGEYELVSIITHQGRSADSGHYVAWGKRDEETWWKFDDSTVTECQWKNLDLAGGRSDYHIAVLLLYKQKFVTATEAEINAVTEKIAQDAPSCGVKEELESDLKADNAKDASVTDAA